jgi:hypothetical protein
LAENNAEDVPRPVSNKEELQKKLEDRGLAKRTIEELLSISSFA